jgi:hypothetical protein
MGLFSSLFSSGAAQPGAGASHAELMAYGKRQLFAGKTEPAVRAFQRAAAAAPEDPLPLAYRSWAGRLRDKPLAVADGEKAVDLDPDCAEAHMSLALALVTGSPDFEEAAVPLMIGRKIPPQDADGSVLSIGVFLVFVDVFAAMREDATGLHYDFKTTPLRNAADWLLCGQHAAAFAAFGKILKSGREVVGELGLVATSWAMGNRKSARTFAEFVIENCTVPDRGILAAVRNIHGASRQ